MRSSPPSSPPSSLRERSAAADRALSAPGGSPPPIEPRPELDLARDLPTTPADVEALRRARLHAPPLAGNWLERLAPPTLFGAWPPRRTTAAGRRPFEL